MSCVITYKGNQYSEQEFKKYFNSNTSEFIKEIANSKNVIDSFKNKIDAINYVFQQAPELESIGTKTQYLKYLSTIFPNSKVKDIVYHGTPFEFDTFKKPSDIKENIFNQHLIDDRNPEKIMPDAIYFQFQPKSFRKGKIITAVINSKELIKIDNFSGYSIHYTVGNRKQLEKQLNSKTFDALDITPLQPQYKRELLVFEPEQIHVLGSKLDIQTFKDFMAFENSEFSKYGTYQQFRDFIINKSSIEIENKLIETSKINRVC